MQITCFFRVYFSYPRKEPKDLRCESLHFVHIRKRTDQENYVNLQSYADLCGCRCFIPVNISFLKLKVSLYLQGTYKCFYHGISFSNALLRISGEFTLIKTPSR